MTESNHPPFGTLEYWAWKAPDHPALIKNDFVMSYSDWNKAADRMATALSNLGFKSGDRLGMRLRIDTPWFIIQRALQKLDITIVSVNWKLTPEEAQYILKDSGATALACDDGNVTAWTEMPEIKTLITVNQRADSPGHRFEDLVSQEAIGSFQTQPRQNSILYTSGTTGKPKGVPPADLSKIDPQVVARYMKAMASVPPLPKEHPVVLLTLPLHHGAGPQAAMAASLRGGTIVLLDPYDPAEVLRLIERHRVQVWTSVPTMLLRIKALGDEMVRTFDLSSITALNTGAAPVPKSLKSWVINTFGDSVLWEAYGCSEAGMLTYISPNEQAKKPESSGRPYPEVELKIIDEDWNEVPSGVAGEIAAKTPFVLKRYIGKPELGEDTLKDGFYRTGDVGHVDEDGYLFITDRIKDMIVAGGVNIYPAEIESAICEFPDVAHCAVIGIPHEDFGEQILAFIVSRSAKTVDTPKLAQFLEGRLAKFKRPHQYELVEELPLSPVGKVLKTELREPYWRHAERNI